MILEWFRNNMELSAKKIDVKDLEVILETGAFSPKNPTEDSIGVFAKKIDVKDLEVILETPGAFLQKKTDRAPRHNFGKYRVFFRKRLT